MQADSTNIIIPRHSISVLPQNIGDSGSEKNIDLVRRSFCWSYMGETTEDFIHKRCQYVIDKKPGRLP